MWVPSGLWPALCLLLPLPLSFGAWPSLFLPGGEKTYHWYLSVSAFGKPREPNQVLKMSQTYEIIYGVWYLSSSVGEETESGLWDRMVWFITKVPEERSLVKRVQCAGPRTSHVACLGSQSSHCFLVLVQPADLAGEAAVWPMRFLGRSAAKEPFWAGKILNSIWSNNLLSTQRSTEMLRGCWERKEKGFLAPTWLSRGTQLSLSQMESVFERTKPASKSSAAKKI